MKRRGGDGNGEPCAWHRQEKLSRGEGRQAIAIAAVTMARARAVARSRSSRILPMCGRKRQERIKTMPARGEDDPL
jgi:hypothetical protein